MKEFSKPLIVIAQEKDKVFARVIKSNGEILKGEADMNTSVLEVEDGGRTRKSDSLRPEVGAIIALCKAYGDDPAAVSYEVMDWLADVRVDEPEPTHESEHEAKEDLSGVTLGALAKRDSMRGRLALRRTLTGSYDGRPGEPTTFKDCRGKSLEVGDLVTIAGRYGDERGGYKWEDLPGLHFVAKDNEDGAFIMGIKRDCNAKTGKIADIFKVRLVKRWQEVEVGEEHDMIMAVVDEEDADE